MWSASNRLFTYTNFENKQPDNYKGEEHCVEVRYRGLKWNDLDCSDEHYFICRPREPVSVPDAA